MKRRILIGVLPVMLAFATRAVAGTAPTAQNALEDVALVIEQSFPDLAHLTPAALKELADRTGKGSSGDVVILDVRTADEFAVSHIAGAVRVDPTAKNTAAIIAAAGTLEGKTVIAYCSIGLRSARLLSRIGLSLQDRGAVKLYNLRGGVFQWRNEQRPLVSDSGATSKIHPYSNGWRQYLADAP